MTLDELAKQYPSGTKIKYKNVPLPATVQGVTFGHAMGEPVLVIDVFGNDGGPHQRILGHITPDQVTEVL